MATPVKKPRRTAERILDVTLELFNRFGEPNVSTTLISAELNISTGNLYYHYPAKDLLVDRLFDRYEQALGSLFELIWQYRFLYRDLNDLLSKNRRIETHFQFVLQEKNQAVQSVLAGLGRSNAIRLTTAEAESVATAMVVVATYWLSYEYVRDPRHALEPENAGAALLRGASNVLSLLAPYFEAPQKQHLLGLAQAYSKPAAAPVLEAAARRGTTQAATSARAAL